MANKVIYECVDPAKEYESKELALIAMRGMFGKVYRHSWKATKKLSHIYFKCKYEENDIPCCGLKLRLTEHKDTTSSSYTLWFGSGHKEMLDANGDQQFHPQCCHSHEMEPPRGLNPKIKSYIQETILPFNNDKNNFPMSLVHKVKNYILNESNDSDMIQRITNPETSRSFIGQIYTYIRYKKANLNKQIMMSSFQDIISVCQAHQFNLPYGYKPTDEYHDVHEFAAAMNMGLDDMVLVHLGVWCASSDGKLFFDVLAQLGYDDRELKETNNKLKLSIIVCSPYTLFHLLALSKLPVGRRALFRDGTHGIFNNSTKLITHHLTPDVRYRQYKISDVVGQAVIPFYLLSGEEYKEITMCTDYWMVWVTKTLFGKDLRLDYTGSDGSHAFLNAGQELWGSYFKVAHSTLNCNFHVQKNIGGAIKSNTKLNGKLKTNAVKQVAHKQMSNLQFCKNRKMFDSCLDLILESWEEHGEENSTKLKTSPILYIRKYYGTSPYNTWCVGVTATEGIYSTNNINEALQKVLKAKVALNRTLSNFITTEAPKLLKEEQTRSSHIRVGVNVYPDLPHSIAVGLAHMMDKCTDLFQCTENGQCVWYGNRGGFIGKPLSAARIQLYNHAVNGNAQPFLNLHNNSKDDAVMHMINISKGICRVQKKQVDDKMVYIGDCEECIKRLGFRCNVVVFVKDLQGEYGTIDVSTRTQVRIDETNYDGSETSRGLRGLDIPTTQKRKRGTTFGNNARAYWSNFIDGRSLPSVCKKYLKLQPTQNTNYLEAILEFQDNPMAYRIKQREQYNNDIDKYSNNSQNDDDIDEDNSFTENNNDDMDSNHIITQEEEE